MHIPCKITYSLLGALMVPCFGRLALHGTGSEHEYYRLFIPLMIGGVAGFLVGSMKDKWLVINSKFEETNKALEEKISAQMQAEEALMKNEERYRTIFIKNHSVMLLIDPKDARILDANPAALHYYGWNKEELTAKKITDINVLTENQIFEEMEKAEQERRHHFIFKHRLSNGDIRDVDVFSGPIEFQGNKLLLSIIHDITDRVIVEKEREELIVELQSALREVKTLRGIIPICSKCKKIRNDEGYWQRVEEYIQDRSDAEFSHGICDECKQEIYGDKDWYQNRKKP